MLQLAVGRGLDVARERVELARPARAFGRVGGHADTRAGSAPALAPGISTAATATATATTPLTPLVYQSASIAEI